MSDPLIQLDDHAITGADLLSLSRRGGQLQAMLREWVLEQALAEVELPQDLLDQLLQDFKQQQKLDSEEAYVAFLQQRLLDEELVLAMVSRPHKVVRYREERWGPRANSLYLQHKERYDRLRYRRLQATNADVMQEVYFRLKDREESWESLARQVNPSDPTATGMVGPVAASQVEAPLLSQLRQAGEGKLLRPLQLGPHTVVAQLEEVMPSEFNEELRTLLLRDAFDEWLGEECSRMIQKVSFPR
jgi:hypothetical protein